jgi:hypothetical protein
MPDVGTVILTIGGSAGFIALLNEGFKAIKNRKRERFELEEAISKAPIIRQSLELGNFDVAIKNLLAINTSQAAHLDAQDRIIKDQDHRIADLEEENTVLRARVAHLEDIVERRRKSR